MFITLSVLLAAVCFVPAVAKLRNHPKMVASADHFDIPWARYRLIGIVEVAAAAGVLAGFLWITLGISAAIGMTLILVGALVTHRRAGDNLKHAGPAVIALAISLSYLAVVLCGQH